MSTSRCACAHIDDPSPCEGPTEAVRVVDRHGTATTGCVRHGAILLASLDGGRIYPGPADEDQAAIDTYRRARDLPPFAFGRGGERS